MDECGWEGVRHGANRRRQKWARWGSPSDYLQSRHRKGLQNSDHGLLASNDSSNGISQCSFPM